MPAAKERTETIFVTNFNPKKTRAVIKNGIGTTIIKAAAEVATPLPL